MIELQLIKGISSRADGSMKIKTLNEKQNRERFFHSRGIDPARTVMANLAHGSRIAVAEERDAGKIIEQEADGLVTSVLGLYLGITAADCLPIFFFDLNLRAVGIAHAGWKGIVSGILGSMIHIFHSEFNIGPEMLKVEIGPGICVNHYSVSEERIESFKSVSPVSKRRNNIVYLDLKETARKHLKKLKVGEIVVSPECTYCLSEKYFSARHDKTDPVNTMVAFIGTKKPSE